MSTAAQPQRLPSRISIVGEDTPVARALPQSARRMIGAWCFLDHAGPVQFAPGKGLHVGPHPHIGLQTFTWMIEGEVMHRDSLGHEQIVRPGQVNLMTAGRGIAHTEDSVRDGSRLHAAQLWIALPEEQAQCEPAFDHYPDLPQLEQGGFAITVLAGSLLDRTAPTRIYSPLLGADLKSHGPAHTTLALQADFEYGVMLLEGNATVAAEALTPHELLYLPPGHRALDVRCDGPCQLLLLGGVPFAQPVLLWWNFVGRSQGEFEQALADWNANPNTGGRFGTVRPGGTRTALTAPSLAGARLKAD